MTTVFVIEVGTGEEEAEVIAQQSAGRARTCVSDCRTTGANRPQFSFGQLVTGAANGATGDRLSLSDASSFVVARFSLSFNDLECCCKSVDFHIFST